MLLRIVTAYANSHATSCIERMMAFAPALLGFNDLRHLVTPTFFLETDLFRITYTLSKNEQKLSVGSYKKIQDSVHGTSNPANLRLQSA